MDDNNNDSKLHCTHDAHSNRLVWFSWYCNCTTNRTVLTELASRSSNFLRSFSNMSLYHTAICIVPMETRHCAIRLALITYSMACAQRVFSVSLIENLHSLLKEKCDEYKHMRARKKMVFAIFASMLNKNWDECIFKSDRENEAHW